MPENRDVQDEASQNARTDIARDTSAAAGDDEALDIEGLDLTVESVEERISPSETNVFDK